MPPPAARVAPRLQVVFDDLGIGVLENAWQGYNVSLFAYGQTGAGKSYSMVGYGEDKGIIPCACHELFRRIEENDQPDVTFHVQASMMEIYNEKVRDLFNPSNKANEGGGLKVRDHPKTGPYVDGLCLLPVKDYRQVENLMEEGTKARTVASTQMNATSSRAHTLFTIILTQTKVDKAAGKAMDKVSKISLVDLAGSERASGTGATGDRLKEGAAINKSLSALGNVISALAEASGGGKKKMIPYRDSVLTWLLKESLGGNAKTIMIAALSPADINYEETLGTLRYADRAKQIKNTAIVNEDPNQKMIRELKEEVERLRALAAGHAQPEVDLASLTAQARQEAEEQAAARMKEYEEELAESKKLLEEMSKTWEEKERDALDIEQQRHQVMLDMGLALSTDDMQQPQLININEDPNRSGAIIYALKPGVTTVGRPDAKEPQTIKLIGLNMSQEHVVITNTGGVVSIKRVGGRTWINGQLLMDLEQAAAGPVTLAHNDRVRFGNNHLFRFHDHVAEERRKEERAEAEARGEPLDPEPVIDWEFAQVELASAAGAASVLGQSEEDIKASEERRRQLEEKEAQLVKERAEVDKQLQEQQEELRRKDEEMQKLVGEERTQAQRQIEEEKAAMLERQRHLEEELARRIQEAEASKVQHAREARQHEELHDHLVSMLPLIQEANMVSEELNKNCVFELKIVDEHAVQGHGRVKKAMIETGNRTTVAVRVEDAELGTSRMWSREKFHDKIFAIRDFYHKMMLKESGVVVEGADDMKDPFAEDQQGVILGHAHVYLESLWWLFPIELNCPVIDYKGKTEGEIKVLISLLGPDGKEFTTPDGELGERFDQFMSSSALLRVEIPEARGLPTHLCDYYVQYMDLDQHVHKTRRTGQHNTERFAYSHDSMVTMNKDLEDKLLTEALSFQVWGSEPLIRPMTMAAGRLRTAAARKERDLEEREQRLAQRQAAFEQELLRPMTGAAHLQPDSSTPRGVNFFSMDEEDPDDDEDGARWGSGSGGGVVDRLDMYDDEEQEFRGSSTPSRVRSAVHFEDGGDDEQQRTRDAELEQQRARDAELLRAQELAKRAAQEAEERADQLRRENEELMLRLRAAEEKGAVGLGGASGGGGEARGGGSGSSAPGADVEKMRKESEERLAREKEEKDALAQQLERLKEEQRKQQEEMESKMKELQSEGGGKQTKSKACCVM